MRREFAPIAVATIAGAALVCRCQSTPTPVAGTSTVTLTLAQAEKIALQQNPHVQIARLIALAEVESGARPEQPICPR